MVLLVVLLIIVSIIGYQASLNLRGANGSVNGSSASSFSLPDICKGKDVTHAVLQLRETMQTTARRRVPPIHPRLYRCVRPTESIPVTAHANAGRTERIPADRIRMLRRSHSFGLRLRRPTQPYQSGDWRNRGRLSYLSAKAILLLFLAGNRRHGQRESAGQPGTTGVTATGGGSAGSTPLETPPPYRRGGGGATTGGYHCRHNRRWQGDGRNRRRWHCHNRLERRAQPEQQELLCPTIIPPLLFRQPFVPPQRWQ